MATSTIAPNEIAELRNEIVAMRGDVKRLEEAVQKKERPYLPSNLQVKLAGIWAQWRKRFGDTDLVLGGTVFVHTFVFWGFGLGMMALGPVLNKWKLQPGRHPSKQQYIRLFKVLFRNQGLLILAGLILRKLKVVQDHCRELAEARIPSLRQAFGEVAFHFTVNDILFYFLHGLLHTPYFYKRIHKIHHEFKAPIALASEYAHPIEYLFSNIIPGAVGPHLLKSHPLVAWLWMIIGVGMTCFHHGGYVIPYYPFNEWALLHDYHHFSFYSNLGVTGLLDKVLGTSGGTDYTSWRKEIIKRVRVANSFLFWKHPISSALQVLQNDATLAL